MILTAFLGALPTASLALAAVARKLVVIANAVLRPLKAQPLLT